jgi:Rrf2 family transcriptional regulator, nitric oxide-sensitive transcriptional repressor
VIESEIAMYSQTAEYALRAMASLALRPDELVSTPEIASLTKVPVNYLAKVLQFLAASELITGRRGVGGGYKLARPASDVRLLDVINAVSPVARIESCPLGLPNHGPFLCPLHRRADQAAAAVIAIFEGVTLADLVNDPMSNRPLCDTEATARLQSMGTIAPPVTPLRSATPAVLSTSAPKASTKSAPQPKPAAAKPASTSKSTTTLARKSKSKPTGKRRA